MEWQEQIALAERPYGLGLVPSQEIVEYTNPRHEDVAVAYWKPRLEYLGIEILGVRDVPDAVIDIVVDGVKWKLSRMQEGTYTVPSEVYHRVRAAEAANVPFAFYLWGEEQFDRPLFRMETGSGAGHASGGSGRSVTQQSWFDRVFDPILIAVIPTAPYRGIWCKLGAWFH